MERLIFHVDVNSAFLSWEAARRVRNGEPDLRAVPSCIGGDPNTRRGVVLAKSIPAKTFGVRTGEPLAAALKKCPDLIIAPPDFRLYAGCSRAFMDLCRAYTPVLEAYSIDECFLDLTGMSHLYPDPLVPANEIRTRIRDELGFTVNIGVARNKLCAKMASDFEKPDRVHTLFPEEIPEKMWTLPVGELLFVGRATAEKLRSAQIVTIGDLAHAELPVLKRLLGDKMSRQAHAYANGIDDSPVRDVPEEAKGYSNSITTEENVTTRETANTILLSLCDSVTEHMRGDGARACGVAVTIRYTDFKNRSHQRRLPHPTDSAGVVYETARSLLAELWKDGKPLRLLGVSLLDVTRDPVMRQLSLFDAQERAEEEKEDRLNRTVSEIRSRFGFDAIRRGSLIGSDLGVGRKYKEKRESERDPEP